MGDWADDREYLIPASVWREQVWNGFNVKQMTDILLELGHLMPDSQGKSSQSIAVPGLGKTRCYVVKQSIFGDDDG